MAFDKNKTIEHIRKGFYFSAGYTFGHVTLNDHYEDDDWNPDQTYNGWLVCYFDVRLGAHIANIITIYGTLGIGVGTGDYEHEYKGDPIEDDVTSIKGVAGVGIAGGFIIDNVFYTDHYFNAYHQVIEVYDETISDAFANLIVRFEVGKEWWFGKRWSVGIALNYTTGSMTEKSIDDYYGDGRYSEDEESFANHTFGLTIRLAH